MRCFGLVIRGLEGRTLNADLLIYHLRRIVRSLSSRPLLFNPPLQLGLEAAIDGLVVRALDAEVVLIDPALRRVVRCARRGSPDPAAWPDRRSPGTVSSRSSGSKCKTAARIEETFGRADRRGQETRAEREREVN